MNGEEEHLGRPNQVSQAIHVCPRAEECNFDRLLLLWWWNPGLFIWLSSLSERKVCVGSASLPAVVKGDAIPAVVPHHTYL